jgi:hypothetical protein
MLKGGSGHGDLDAGSALQLRQMRSTIDTNFHDIRFTGSLIDRHIDMHAAFNDTFFCQYVSMVTYNLHYREAAKFNSWQRTVQVSFTYALKTLINGDKTSKPFSEISRV